MANKNTNNGKKGKGKGKMAAGLAAASAGAAVIGAGAYYLLGPNKKEHQKKAKALFERMKKEVAREAKKAKTISMPVYHQAVDAISDAYAKEYRIHEKDIKAIAQKLKGEWKNMRGAAQAKSKNTGQKKKAASGPRRAKK